MTTEDRERAQELLAWSASLETDLQTFEDWRGTMQAVEDTTYNGWKNYPTWCVNLWLSNDEGLYNETLCSERG